jgi:hypothetical protein
MEWKILDIEAKDGLITSAKYYVSNGTVDTEGNWYFPESGQVPFEQVTEEMVIKWIKESSMKDGKNIIESRIEEQSEQPVRAVPPWLPQTFTPKL